MLLAIIGVPVPAGISLGLLVYTDYHRRLGALLAIAFGLEMTAVLAALSICRRAGVAR